MRGLKLSLVALCATFITFTANAEIIGVSLSAGGINSHYSIKGNDSAITNNSGYQVGVAVPISLTFLSITPEVRYSQSKFQITDASILGRPCDVKSKSVDMPIIAGFSILGPLKVELGPSFSLYDSAKAQFYTNNPYSEQDLGKIHTSVGFVAGAKLTVVKKIILSVRYNGQFGGRNNSFNQDESYKVKNYSLSFGVGFKIM